MRSPRSLLEMPRAALHRPPSSCHQQGTLFCSPQRQVVDLVHKEAGEGE